MSESPHLKGPRRVAGVLATLVFVSVSCDSPSEPRSLLDLEVNPTSQWSGGEIRIVFESGLDPNDVQAVMAGPDTLVFNVQGSSTITAKLPSDANGSRQVWVQTPSKRLPAGTVEVYGFLGSKIVSPRLVRGLRDWKSGLGAAVIGPTGAGIGIVRPAGGPGTVFDGIHNSELLYSPGQSADPLEVYARTR